MKPFQVQTAASKSGEPPSIIQGPKIFLSGLIVWGLIVFLVGGYTLNRNYGALDDPLGGLFQVIELLYIFLLGIPLIIVFSIAFVKNRNEPNSVKRVAKSLNAAAIALIITAAILLYLILSGKG
ncbi:hypothetical protein HY640_01890 [Candidatus Woesearchaeota archaeon]|nr:hypothetical protein [Candidatus Woesearchaeota archaeon]